MKFIAFLIDCLGWLRIAASPILISIALAVALYINLPNNWNLALALVTIQLGIIVGIMWASRVWKKHGTMNFLAGKSEASSNQEEEE